MSASPSPSPSDANLILAEAEANILGSFISVEATQHPIMGLTSVTLLRDTHFSDPRNAKVFRALHGLYDTNASIDRTSAIEAVMAAGMSDATTYVDELISIAAPLSNTEDRLSADLGRIHNAAYGRFTALALANVAKAVGTMSATEHMAMQDKALEAVANEFIGTAGKQTMSDLVDMLLDDISNPKSHTATGYEHLDGVLNGGFQDGNLVILAARPGVGKSALALGVALNAARASRDAAAADGTVAKQVAFFSYEMSELEMLQRALAILSEMSYNAILDCLGPDANAPAPAKLKAAITELRGLPMNFNCEVSEIGALTTLVKTTHRKTPYCLIIVDYIGLMEARGIGDDQMVAKLTSITKGLKRLAAGVEAPILALSQFNRQAADTTPKLHMLRDSGSVEQDANTVLFLRHPYETDTTQPEHLMEVIVAKQRSGQNNVCLDIGFERSETRFYTVPTTARPMGATGGGSESNGTGPYSDGSIF